MASSAFQWSFADLDNANAEMVDHGTSVDETIEESEGDNNADASIFGAAEVQADSEVMRSETGDDAATAHDETIHESADAHVGNSVSSAAKLPDACDGSPEVTQTTVTEETSTAATVDAKAQGVFGDSNHMLIVADASALETLFNIRNINHECRRMVEGISRFQKQVMIGPATKLLDVDRALPQTTRTTHIAEIRWSPYIKGMTTQKFLFNDNMAGWCKDTGSLMVNFLPNAAEAWRHSETELRARQLCCPAVQQLEMIVFKWPGSNIDTSTKVVISIPTGVTMWDVLNQWVLCTQEKIERGAPVCLTIVGGEQASTNISQGHSYANILYCSLRNCLIDLDQIPEETSAGREYFCQWEQDENLLLKWYAKTCVEGEQWFAAGEDAKAQKSFIRVCEAEAGVFTSRKLIAEANPNSPTWVLECLKWKRGLTKANTVFTRPEFSGLLGMIAARCEDGQLANLWRVNRTTANLFSTDPSIRRRLLLEPVAGYATPINATILCEQAKERLRQFLTIKPMFGRIITTHLVGDLSSEAGEIEGAGCKLFHVQKDRVVAAFQAANDGTGVLSGEYHKTRSSAYDMRLTSPPLKVVYLHLALWEDVQNPGTPAEWKVGCGKPAEDVSCHVDGIRTIRVSNSQGVTIGDVVDSFHKFVTSDMEAGLPVVLSLLEGGATGAQILAEELEQLEPTLAALRAIREQKLMREVFTLAMDKLEDGEPVEMDKQRFKYYSQLFAAGDSQAQGW